MIVAGIDPSLTSAGIAILDHGRPHTLTHVGHGSHNGANWNQRSRRIRYQCRRILDTIEEITDRAGLDYPELTVIEGPSYASHHGHAFDRAGLWHGLYGALDAQNMPVAVVAPQTLKKFATGKATAQKADVIAAAETWCHPAVDDEADAAWLACMGAIKLGCYPPVALTDWRLNGINAVAWPEAA